MWPSLYDANAQPSVQVAYLQHFLDDPSQFGYAEELFKKFLKRASPSVDLLKVYLTYIRCEVLCVPQLVAATLIPY